MNPLHLVIPKVVRNQSPQYHACMLMPRCARNDTSLYGTPLPKGIGPCCCTLPSVAVFVLPPTAAEAWIIAAYLAFGHSAYGSGHGAGGSAGLAVRA